MSLHAFKNTTEQVNYLLRQAVFFEEIAACQIGRADMLQDIVRRDDLVYIRAVLSKAE
jgi:hypothetical protein